MAAWEKIICTYKRMNVSKIERNSPAGGWGSGGGEGGSRDMNRLFTRNKYKWPMTTRKDVQPHYNPDSYIA